MEACLRLYPKRILLGEIRGSEAFTYLNLISSGHGGSIATLHANDPVNAIERLTLMVLMAGTTLTSDQVKMFVNQSIDIIVQLGRTETGGYGCSSIYFKAYEDMKNEKTIFLMLLSLASVACSSKGIDGEYNRIEQTAFEKENGMSSALVVSNKGTQVTLKIHGVMFHFLRSKKIKN